MNNELVTEIARKWKGAGEALDFRPDNSRLLIGVWRTLAKGRPVSGQQIDQIISDLGVNEDAAGEFSLNAMSRTSTERSVPAIRQMLRPMP